MVNGTPLRRARALALRHMVPMISRRVCFLVRFGPGLADGIVSGEGAAEAEVLTRLGDGLCRCLTNLLSVVLLGFDLPLVMYVRHELVVMAGHEPVGL